MHLQNISPAVDFFISFILTVPAVEKEKPSDLKTLQVISEQTHVLGSYRALWRLF